MSTGKLNSQSVERTMPTRVYRKRRPRRYARRRRAPAGTARVSRPLRNTITTIARRAAIRTAEAKSSATSLASTAVEGDNWVDLNTTNPFALGQGDLRYQRDGAMVYGQNLLCNYDAVSSVLVGVNHVRILVLRWKREVTPSTTSGHLPSHWAGLHQPDYKESYSIVMDKTYTFRFTPGNYTDTGTGGSTAQNYDRKRITFSIPLKNKKLLYNEGTTNPTNEKLTIYARSDVPNAVASSDKPDIAGEYVFAFRDP